MTIKEALEYFKGYCEKHKRCYECSLNKEDYCYISCCKVIPCDWDLPHLFKEEER